MEIVVKELVKAVERAELLDNPFPIFYMEDCFPQDFYKLMTSHMLDPKRYAGFNRSYMLRKDGTSTRSVFDLSEDNLTLLQTKEQEIWLCIRKTLLSDEIKKAIFGKLRSPLSMRFGITKDQVEKIEAYPRCVLSRDIEGFKIFPHPDVPSKIVTVMFYLPTDLSQLDIGTTFYKYHETKITKWLLTKFDFARKFVPSKQFEFKPNSGYAFAVTNRSWHGRDKLSTSAGIRNTLALTYFDKEENAQLKEKEYI